MSKTARAQLFQADDAWLNDECADCGHPRKRHLYNEGACVYVTDSQPLRYCRCGGFSAAPPPPDLTPDDLEDLERLEDLRPEEPKVDA